MAYGRGWKYARLLCLALVFSPALVSCGGGSPASTSTKDASVGPDGAGGHGSSGSSSSSGASSGSSGGGSSSGSTSDSGEPGDDASSSGSGSSSGDATTGSSSGDATTGSSSGDATTSSGSGSGSSSSSGSGSSSDGSADDASEDAASSSGSSSGGSSGADDSGEDAGVSPACTPYMPQQCGNTSCDLRSNDCCDTLDLSTGTCPAGTTPLTIASVGFCESPPVCSPKSADGGLACLGIDGGPTNRDNAIVGCASACDCGQDQICCANHGFTTATSSCQSASEPCPGAGTTGAQLCITSAECVNDMGCITQSCFSGSSVVSACGLQAQTPYDCTPLDGGD